LEHILPENPSNEWESEFPTDIEENFIYRLGNFTILESDKNKLLGNRDFFSKLEGYKTSRYELSKKIGFKTWSQDNLSIRQKYMAKQAKAIWSLPYLQSIS